MRHIFSADKNSVHPSKWKNDSSMHKMCLDYFFCIRVTRQIVSALCYILPVCLVCLFLSLMIHRATSWQCKLCCLGSFLLRMGNKFLSGYFRFVVGRVNYLVAR